MSAILLLLLLKNIGSTTDIIENKIFCFEKTKLTDP